MRMRIPGLVITLVSLFGATALADDLESEMPEAAQTTAAIDTQVMALSLDEAVEFALEYNLDV